MKNVETWRSRIIALCALAMNGSMTIEEFYQRWPEELHESVLANLIYEDIENGVQHFPAKLLSGIPDYKLWRSSDMYRRILIDSEILKINESESKLVEVRNALLMESGLPLGDISMRAAELFRQLA